MAVTSLRTKVILILPFGRFFRYLGAFSVQTIWAPVSGIRFKASHVFLMRRRTWGRRNEELMYNWKRGKKLQLKENIKVEQESGKRLATKQFGNVARPCRWSISFQTNLSRKIIGLETRVVLYNLFIWGREISLIWNPAFLEIKCQKSERRGSNFILISVPSTSVENN